MNQYEKMLFECKSMLQTSDIQNISEVTDISTKTLYGVKNGSVTNMRVKNLRKLYVALKSEVETIKRLMNDSSTDAL